MNKYILKSMRYIDNPQAFTSEEMQSNVYAADTAAAIAAAAAHTARATAYATAYAGFSGPAAAADNTVDRYFSITGENRQDYEAEIQ